jgi:hypothetical protein
MRTSCDESRKHVAPSHRTRFAYATLLGVPLGLFIGGDRRAWQAANPVIQCSDISPLAWFHVLLAAAGARWWLLARRENDRVNFDEAEPLLQS